jgi:hypothetical protein
MGLLNSRKDLDTNHAGVVGHSRRGWSAIVACRRDERIKARVSEDGNAGGQGLQYPGASIPKESNLYVEVSSFCKALLKKSTSTVLSASDLPTKSAFAGILFRYCPFNFTIQWLQSVSPGVQ